MIQRFLILLIVLSACQPMDPSTGGWQKVFRNDAQGNAVYGEKSKVIDAVRLGYPIRIGWGGSRVEHVAEAEFLTILDDKEVFAQIDGIIGQAPTVKNDSLKVRFRLQNHWTKIAGTNGYSTGFMTDYFADTIVGGGTMVVNLRYC